MQERIDTETRDFSPPTTSRLIGEDAEFKRDWKSHHSGFARYVRADLFDSEIIGRAKRLTQETILEKVWKWSIPVAAIFFFMVAVILALLNVQAPSFDGSVDSAVSMILYGLSLGGLSERLFQNDFILTAILTAVVGLAFQYSITREIRKKTQRFVDLVEFFEEQTRFARQIFIGTGNIQFSFGAEGFYVNGDVLDMRMNWRVFFGKEFVRKVPKDDPENLSEFSFVTGADVDDATHLLIYMKPGMEEMRIEDQMPELVFIVVPRSRFFTDQLGADDWEAFCSSLDAKVPTL